MKIDIDVNSGFCFGVVNAIERAEKELSQNGILYSLGDIVHNKIEVNRLTADGLVVISHNDLDCIKGKRVYIRAHGEPPWVFQKCNENNITVIDSTCPVVSALQRQVITAFAKMEPIGGQVVILGKVGHPEVIGLNGQIDNRGIIVESVADLDEKVDFSRPIFVLAQTTKSLSSFNEIVAEIRNRFQLPQEQLVIRDTICRNVSNRGPKLEAFAGLYDLILFVSGKESSNGAALFGICKASNPNSYKIERIDDIDYQWFIGVSRVGICGATSTPKWLMEEIAAHLEQRYNTQ